MFVAAVGQMLDWIEGKYEQQFHYISYAPGDAIEQEHLKVYPEQGSEADVVDSVPYLWKMACTGMKTITGRS